MLEHVGEHAEVDRRRRRRAGVVPSKRCDGGDLGALRRQLHRAGRDVHALPALPHSARGERRQQAAVAAAHLQHQRRGARAALAPARPRGRPSPPRTGRATRRSGRRPRGPRRSAPRSRLAAPLSPARSPRVGYGRRPRRFAMAIDFQAEGLLDGLDGPAREARRELLERLASDGYELDELRERRARRAAAAGGGRARRWAEGRLATPSARSPSAPDSRLDFLRRLWRALGMALADGDERAFTDADLEAAERVKAFRDAGLDDDRILELSRVMGRSMYGVAAAIGEVFRETYQQPGDDELSLALRYAEAARGLTPMLGPDARARAARAAAQPHRPGGGGGHRAGRGPAGRLRGGGDLLRRPGGLHQARGERGAGRAGSRRRPARGAGGRGGRAAGAPDQDHRGRRDAAVGGHRRAAGRGAGDRAGGGRRGRGLSAAVRRPGAGRGAVAGRATGTGGR